MNQTMRLAQFPGLSSSWVDPIDQPDPPVEGVHVWRVFLDPSDEALETGRTWLSAEEVKRAVEFYRAADKAGFINTHARHEPTMGLIEKIFFNDCEAEFIAAAPPEKQPETFFTIWTLREAFMKATGDGFTLPQDAFKIEIEAGRDPGLVTEQPADSTWSLSTIIPAPGYLGALAVSGKNHAYFPVALRLCVYD